MIQQVLGFSFPSEEPRLGLSAEFSLEQKILLEKKNLAWHRNPCLGVSASPHSALERIKQQSVEIKWERTF